MSFTKREHPLYRYFASRFTFEHRYRNDDFSGHPYCLHFLKEVLKDVTPAGITYQVEKEQLLQISRISRGSGSLHGELKDAAKRKEAAESRRCDEQMIRMREVVFGLVEFHPLLKDSQARFDRNMKWIDSNTFRAMSRYEAMQFVDHTRAMMPILQPLKAPATADDVAANKAAFHLNGQGNCIDMALPAWIVAKEDFTQNYVRRRGLILQAEVMNGKKQYGVLYSDGLKTVPEEAVHRIDKYQSE